MTALMAPTGANLIKNASTRLTRVSGWQYEVDTQWDPIGRNQFRLTGSRHTTDCSGHVFLACHSVWTPGDPTHSKPFVVPTTSWALARWCHAAGTYVSVAEALKHPGYLLFRGPNLGMNGYGADGHVGFTQGDGVNVNEAEGHVRDILIDPAAPWAAWDGAAAIPGVDYTASGGGAVGTIPPLPEGNPMYAQDEFCSTFTDGHGNTWSLRPNGDVYTRTGTEFWGAYRNLLDPAGHPLAARTDFGSITGRWDQRPGQPVKPGYTLWPLHYRPGEHYDFGPDHPGRLARGLAELAGLLK